MNDTQLITLDHLEKIGLTKDTEDTSALLKKINGQLDERIGEEVSLSLSDEQLDEMMKLQEDGDEDALDEWMSKNVPDLEQIAEDERDIMLGELAENADKLAS